MWAAVVMCAVLGGCGYTTRSMISSTYRTIHIPPFANKIDITRDTDAADKYQITRPTLETDVTKAVINKFLFDGNLRPIKEDNADLVLKGELVQFRRDPLRYSSADDVDEYRLSITVNIILWDKKADQMVWQENGFTGDTTYYPSTSTLQSVTKKSDDQAVSDAVADLARRIVERTVEEW